MFMIFQKLLQRLKNDRKRKRVSKKGNKGDGSGEDGDNGKKKKKVGEPGKKSKEPEEEDDESWGVRQNEASLKNLIRILNFFVALKCESEN